MSRTTLADAFTQIRGRATLDDLDISLTAIWIHSGFRKAFEAFGVPPGSEPNSDFIATQILETPLGLCWSGTDSKGVCLIEYWYADAEA